MSGKSEINGLSVPENPGNENQNNDTLDFYIGVFFDGTNNNKYQVAIGKMFRRRHIFNDHEPSLKLLLGEYELDGQNYKKISSSTITRYPRSFWEEGDGKGIFNQSELDFLYFGYENINNHNDNSYNTFVENKSKATLSNNDIYQLTAKSDSKNENDKLIEVLDCIIDDEDGDDSKTGNGLSDDDIEGAGAQNATYTNVAILESLYKCSANEDESKEKHFSIYVEGSGTDMQVEAAKNILHIGGYGLMGLSKGIGSSGAIAKVRKAVLITDNLIQRYMPTNGGTREIKIHFDICGFSRGATSARMFCYVINSNRDESSKEYCGDDSILKHDIDLKMFTGKDKPFLPLNKENIGVKLIEKEIRNLLIADTVSSIGVLSKKGNDIASGLVDFLVGGAMSMEFVIDRNENVDGGSAGMDVFGKSNYHNHNVDDYGLWATKLAKKVVHICAMDEVRENFALVDIESSIINDSGTEIFLPGCHTDIGGAASIEMDDKYTMKKDYAHFINHYFVHTKKTQTGVPSFAQTNVHNLKAIGWLNPDSEEIVGDSDKTSYNESEKAIELYRHVKPGYSNIALNLFWNAAEDDIFNEIPSSYYVPNDLKPFYNSIQVSDKGRYFYYPKNPEQYYWLRRNYLHLSFNEGFTSKANNFAVNSPEYVIIQYESSSGYLPDNSCSDSTTDNGLEKCMTENSIDCISSNYGQENSNENLFFSKRPSLSNTTTSFSNIMNPLGNMEIYVTSRIIYTGEYNSPDNKDETFNNLEMRRHMFDYDNNKLTIYQIDMKL